MKLSTESPNPSDGLFTIRSANNLGTVSLQVFDVRGRAILNQQNVDFDNNEATVDLSGCQSGLYILKITGSDFSYSHKLIKN
ncbi:T9SS type A sorting domain-containing protein [Flavobacterium sp.]